jgi:hypothetical protein
MVQLMMLSLRPPQVTPFIRYSLVMQGRPSGIQAMDEPGMQFNHAHTMTTMLAVLHAHTQEPAQPGVGEAECRSQPVSRQTSSQVSLMKESDSMRILQPGCGHSNCASMLLLANLNQRDAVRRPAVHGLHTTNGSHNSRSQRCNSWSHSSHNLLTSQLMPSRCQSTIARCAE